MTIVTEYDGESDTWTHHNGDTCREVVASFAHWPKGRRQNNFPIYMH
jgi:hypothetical protein